MPRTPKNSTAKPYSSSKTPLRKPSAEKHKSQEPRSESKANTDVLSYRELSNVWEEWREQPPRTAMDRWLKKQASYRSSLIRQYPLLSLAMYQAQRFQQLACALETFYKHPDTDWLTWDKEWHHLDIDALHISDFWYWVQLRSQERWRWPAYFNQYDDQKQAFDDFHTMAQTPLTPAWMLWHGLRPQWLPLLLERQQHSGWTDEQLIAWAEQQNTPPPVWLRVNGEHDLDQLQQQLHDDGINIKRRGDHLCALGGRGINQTRAYKAGHIDIQDLASQQAAFTVGAQPGEKIWDACTGAGGKTLAMASQMQQKGAIVATDLHDYKLDELKRRAKRSGYLNIRTFTWDGEAPLRLPKEIQRQQGFDRVLVDAPCTSSGTWRRNPDARWRFNDEDSAELVQLQRRLLGLASQAVRVEGTLVYATCSWQVSENEGIVNDFITQNPQFECLEKRLLGAPHQDSDTLFVATLVRRS